MPDMAPKTETIVHPAVTPEAEWRQARIALLTEEKDLTRHRDRVNAQRRRLPMVKVEKDYEFIGTGGKQSLLDLFESRRQLVIYHFMFDTDWENGCPGCTSFGNALGDLSLLGKKDTTFAMTSRAPLEKLQDYRQRKGWNMNWLSSGDSDFNRDFGATITEVAPFDEYNYRSNAEWAKIRGKPILGEEHGFSVFFRIGDEVYHTYSAYARGTEGIIGAYAMLDMTPYGRQQEFEDSPAGWPQAPTYG